MSKKKTVVLYLVWLKQTWWYIYVYIISSISNISLQCPFKCTVCNFCCWGGLSIKTTTSKQQQKFDIIKGVWWRHEVAWDSFPLITSTVATHHPSNLCRRSFIMNRKYLNSFHNDIKDQCISHSQPVIKSVTLCLTKVKYNYLLHLMTASCVKMRSYVHAWNETFQPLKGRDSPDNICETTVMYVVPQQRFSCNSYNFSSIISYLCSCY